jgi:hypothetical protein
MGALGKIAATQLAIERVHLALSLCSVFQVNNTYKLAWMNFPEVHKPCLGFGLTATVCDQSLSEGIVHPAPAPLHPVLQVSIIRGQLDGDANLSLIEPPGSRWWQLTFPFSNSFALGVAHLQGHGRAGSGLS